MHWGFFTVTVGLVSDFDAGGFLELKLLLATGVVQYVHAVVCGVIFRVVRVEAVMWVY